MTDQFHQISVHSNKCTIRADRLNKFYRWPMKLCEGNVYSYVCPVCLLRVFPLSHTRTCTTLITDQRQFLNSSLCSTGDVDLSQSSRNYTGQAALWFTADVDLSNFSRNYTGQAALWFTADVDLSNFSRNYTGQAALWFTGDVDLSNFSRNYTGQAALWFTGRCRLVPVL